MTTVSVLEVFTASTQAAGGVQAAAARTSAAGAGPCRDWARSWAPGGRMGAAAPGAARVAIVAALALLVTSAAAAGVPRRLVAQPSVVGVWGAR